MNKTLREKNELNVKETVLFFNSANNIQPIYPREVSFYLSKNTACRTL